MPILLSVRNLRKVYPGKPPFVAVDGISFELSAGEILGLLGANGAGKTTTIQMLLSTLTYSEGEIQFFGKELRKHRSEVLQHVSFASAYVSLPWKLTVAQNLEVFGRIYGLSKAEIFARANPLLERFGIMQKRNAMVTQLSAGQTTRLMIIKAYLTRPRIVLLDEPTASLDPDVAQDVCQFILEQRDKEGTAVLFTSHKMDEVAELCDRVLFMQKGKIIADDLPEKLAYSVSKCSIELLVGDGMKRSIAVVEKLKLPYKVEHRMIQIELDETQIAKVLSEFALAGVSYTNIKVIQPTLEDYFLKMAGKK
ncbi:MAG: ABC transporter ATP-binding protein [Verrucomicrobia bacterium]|nr:ABC transporter ATP-binding protein [Verrucomicrobiota bacterium]